MACNGDEDIELQKCLARAGDEQLEIERKGTDLAMLAWALRRMVNFKRITIQSSYTRHRSRRLARKQKHWEKQEKRYLWLRDPRPGPLSECTDWDMRLDTQRVFVLLLKAMKMAKRSPAGSDESGWFDPRRESDEDWSDIRASMDHDLQMEQLEYDNKLVKESEGRKRDTLHAFHVWENCLRRHSQNMDDSRTEASDIQQQGVAGTAQSFMDLSSLHELLRGLDHGVNAKDRSIPGVPHDQQLAPASFRPFLNDHLSNLPHISLQGFSFMNPGANSLPGR